MQEPHRASRPLSGHCSLEAASKSPPLPSKASQPGSTAVQPLPTTHAVLPSRHYQPYSEPTWSLATRLQRPRRNSPPCPQDSRHNVCALPTYTSQLLVYFPSSRSTAVRFRVPVLTLGFSQPFWHKTLCPPMPSSNGDSRSQAGTYLLGVGSRGLSFPSTRQRPGEASVVPSFSV